VVSISGCDPLDPGSNPGTAITFFCWLGVWNALPRELFVCALFSGMECPVYIRGVVYPSTTEKKVQASTPPPSSI
jgi:hypothetical protein